MSIERTVRRTVRLTAWLALGLGLGIGCQLVIDRDGLDNEQCARDEKPCPSVRTCVKKDNPLTRCEEPLTCAPCNLPNAQASCMRNSAGKYECAIALCVKPYLDCDRMLDGCETDPDHDPNNCGATQLEPGPGCRPGIACTTLPNALRPACSAGKCTIGGCKPGFAHCDDSIPNGCEADLLNSSEHCGECHRPCANCQDGGCPDAV